MLPISPKLGVTRLLEYPAFSKEPPRVDDDVDRIDVDKEEAEKKQKKRYLLGRRSLDW